MTADHPVTRIAMWSGPRNISTAMMYSFASRPDCVVWDEPFYAFYLSLSGISHPMEQVVIDAGIESYDEAVTQCLTGPGEPASVFYQKHMTHHMLPGYDRGWMYGLSNAFLIRAPERVLASYAKKRAEVTLRDIGFIEQAEIFDAVAQHLGEAPPVVDTDDILANPKRTLGRLCERLGIAFDEAMLSWKPGPKPYDGAWAPHWYNAVWQSTGFNAPPADDVALPDDLRKIADEARPLYEKLKAHRL
jgi:hypothetical protein